MAYIKNTWVDQDVERPKTYEVTNNQDGSITLTDSFGLVTELGTPVNETNMNHIEDGIAGCAIRKYSSTETFDLGEWVLGGTGDDESIYKSLVANNLGNAVTDDTKWEKVELGGGASRNVGEIVASTLPLVDAALHLMDGSLLVYGSYKKFIDFIADLYAENPTANYFTTEASWQSSVTTYGSCGKFVYDSVNKTVRLPRVSNILQGTTDASALGDIIEAGLPNITGTFNASWEVDVARVVSGAFNYTTNTPSNESAGSSGSGGVLWNLDASRSSSIYGNSNTVQPQTVKCLLYIVVATSSKKDIQIDIDEIATDLNGKADTDLSNLGATQSANLDGQWVAINHQLANNVTWDNTTAEATYDISSYLPDDIYNYEVIISGQATASATQQKFCTIQLKSDIQTSNLYVTSARAVTTSGVNEQTSANTFIPVGTGRYITQYASTSSNAGGVYSLWIKGYRRIGTNV